MKTTFIVALLFVTGITLGGIAAYTWTQKQTIIKKQEAIQQSNDAETARQAAAQNQAVVTKLNSTITVLRAECLKGQTAYAQLTAIQKTKVQPITCDASSN